MNWCCFQFWFCYRLILACLAHINWVVAVYVNCIYFVLWKSYDLVWFWSHFILCLCCVPLRNENYLLVWFNILYKKWTKYPNRSIKEIYILEYGSRKKRKVKSHSDDYNLERQDVPGNECNDDKSNREAAEIATTSAQFRFSNFSLVLVLIFRVDNGVMSETDASHTSSSSSSEEKNKIKKDRKRRACKVMVIGEEEQDCMEQIYIGRACDNKPGQHQEDIYSSFGSKAYADANKHKLEALKKKKEKRNDVSSMTLLSSNTIGEKGCKSRWYKRVFCSCSGQRSNESYLSSDARRGSSGGNTADEESVHVTDFYAVAGSNSRSDYSTFMDSNSIDLLKPDFTNTFDAENDEVRLKREKKERKALTKRIRERKRLQLLRITKREAKCVDFQIIVRFKSKCVC
uniref:G_PROTEIN_RECEP_F1_2 domain-containing protein n=1 Tax=Syphacia muris TaxID=451379 RepID=A0A0N5ABZ4_9BILA